MARGSKQSGAGGSLTGNPGPTMEGRSRIEWVRRARNLAKQLRGAAWLDSKVEVPLAEIEAAVFRDLAGGAVTMTAEEVELFVMGPGDSRVEQKRYKALCGRWPTANYLLDGYLT